MKRILLLLMAAGMVVQALVAQRTAVPLFRDAGNPPLTEQQAHFLKVIQNDPTAASVRLVTVDLQALRRAERLRLDALDAYGDVYLTRQNVEQRGNTDLSWFGAVDGYPLATANLVLDGPFVHANLRFDDGLFTLEPLGGGLHALVVRRYERYLPENCAPAKRTRSGEPVKKTNADERQSAQSACSIRLLVAFTDDVAAMNANPRGTIQLATDNYNNANSNSNVAHRVEIARILMVDYAESGDSDTDLDRFRNPSDGIMDNIHDERDRYDADLCCLIPQVLNDGCGLADAIGATYGSAFQVTAFGCAADNLTFAHEFGHLLNARHDTFVDNTAGSNHGLTYLPGNWRTVMAYNDACDCSDEVSPCPDADNRATPGTPFCTRVQWWSNPLVSYLGNATGTNARSNNRGAIDAYDNTAAAFEGLAVDKTLSAAETINEQEEANYTASGTVSNTSGAAVRYAVGSKGSFRAGSGVTLRPGFRADAGSEFRAYLGTCTNTLPLDDDAPAETRSASVDTEPATLEVWPNPATEAFNVRFELAADAIVRLDLLDGRGQTVQHLLPTATPFAAGQHDVPCNAAELPPGAYYLRLRHNSQTSVKTVVLTR